MSYACSKVDFPHRLCISKLQITNNVILTSDDCCHLEHDVAIDSQWHEEIVASGEMFVL